MNLEIFSIFDAKADAYITPFFLPNKAMAMRAFADCINSSSHQFGQNPQDYTLFHIGRFDDSSAAITSDNARSLGNGLEFKKPLDTLDAANSLATQKVINFGGTN